MSLWAILPVKPLEQGKSRLSHVLSQEERFLLSSTLLGNTLRVLKNSKGIDQILVVSRDKRVLDAARGFDVQIVHEKASSNLNLALSLARSFAKTAGATEILVIPVDIPLLETRFIEDLVSQTQDGTQMIIVPDRRGDGTNALFLSPPDAIAMQFGPGSYRRHLAAAIENGLKYKVMQNSALGLDLDLPEDLEVFGRVEVDSL
jgi:2-phospho-L-lactate guanylyltransferase